MMITKITRRMMCEVQGCRKRAEYGLGKKGNDYPLCGEHFHELGLEIQQIILGANTPKDETPASDEEPVLSGDAMTGTESPTETTTPEAGEPDKAEVTAFNTCKYCGEKFPKDDPLPYMNHVKACKKIYEPKPAPEKAAKKGKKK